MPDPGPRQPISQPTVLRRPLVVWYGERGVVNALVTSLTRRDIESGVRKLLLGITWADGGHPTWIDHVTDVTLIVEVGLSEFGDPDLIVVCRTDDGQRFVAIVKATERKVGTSKGNELTSNLWEKFHRLSRGRRTVNPPQKRPVSATTKHIANPPKSSAMAQ